MNIHTNKSILCVSISVQSFGQLGLISNLHLSAGKDTALILNYVNGT